MVASAKVKVLVCKDDFVRRGRSLHIGGCNILCLVVKSVPNAYRSITIEYILQPYPRLKSKLLIQLIVLAVYASR